MPAMNEEKLKKNTDCIYFLASPFTCTKGNDCKFRHSEIARLNPRDCWFWPAGKCINSKCEFRHPPLKASTAAGAKAGKQRVRCFFFDHGYCAKGEKCTFMHGLASAAVEPAALPAETQKSPKLYLKPNDCLECSEKSSKRVCSLTSKVSLELKQECGVPKSEELQTGKVTDRDAEACLSAELQGQVTDASSRMPATPEYSTAAPARGGSHESVSGSNKSKQVTVIDDSPYQVYPAADTSVKLPSKEVNMELSVKDECCEVGPGGKRLQRVECYEARPGGRRLKRVDSPENRIYDCTESGELLEESSFDVLVDDVRTDQVAYVEDTNSLPSFSVPMDPVRGCTQRLSVVGGTDQLAKYDYSHYFVQDSPGNRSCAFRGRLSQYEQQMVPENGNDQTFMSTKDLRYHIIQRSRPERSLKVEEDFHGRHPGGFMKNDLQNHPRYHESHRRYQEELITRARIASAEQVFGWQECRRSTHNYGHCRPKYFKRGWNEAPDFGRTDRERVNFNKKLRHETEYNCFQANGKGLWLDAGAFDPVLHEFVSTTSLAALGAEKLTHLKQQDGANQMTYVHQAQRQLPLPIGSCTISPAAVTGTTYNGYISVRRPSESSRTPDFEGPKPLSVLREEKRRRLASAEPEGDKKVSRTESEGGTLGNVPSLKSPDHFKAPELSGLLRIKRNGVANGEANKGVKAFELQETEVGYVSSKKVPQSIVESLETNTACMKKDDSVQNSTSNLPVHSHGVTTGGLTSCDGKAACLISIKDTNTYPTETDLSLSLSSPRCLVQG